MMVDIITHEDGSYEVNGVKFDADGKITDEALTGVFAYVSAEGDTTCTLADTWYPLNATFTNEVLEQFQVVADPAIEYLNGDAKFKLDLCGTFVSDTNGVQIHLGVKINGTFYAPSEAGNFFKTGGEPGGINGVSVFDLSEGDKVQLVLSCDTAGAVITTKHFTTTLHRFR